MNPVEPERKSVPREVRLVLLGFIVFTLASLGGLYQLVALAVEKVLAGKGFETYHTFRLVEFSYVGVLVTLGCMLLAAVISFFFWWREERQWRDFERKYGANSDA